MEAPGTTIKEEVLQEVLQWQDVKVKEEETEEEMSDRELGLLKTVHKLKKKNRKRKERLEVERRKVRSLEQEVEELRSRLQVFEATEQQEVEDGDGEEVGPLADEEVVEVEGSKGAEGGGDDTGVEELETETSSENRKDDDEQEVGVPEEGAPPAKALRRSSRAARGPALAKPARARTGNFKCGKTGCAYRAAHREHMEDHMRAEHGAAKLSCTEPGCAKEFRSARGLHFHIRAAHQGFTFKCTKPGCDYTATQRHHLSNHNRAKHGAPKLECPEADCGQQFVSYSGLRYHKRAIHMGIVIKCSEPGCSYKAMYSSQLRSHKKKHMG